MRNLKLLKITSTALVAFIFCNISSVSASALRGIKETNLVIEDLDEDARKCGISKDAIDAAVRLPLSNSRLNLTDRTVENYIYIRMTVLDLGARCAFHINFDFKRYSLEFRQVGTFYQKGEILVWPKNTLSREASNTVELYTKQFIAQWLKANSN